MKETKPATMDTSGFARWLNQARALGSKDRKALLPIALPLDYWMMLAEISARWKMPPGEVVGHLLAEVNDGVRPLLETLNGERTGVNRTRADAAATIIPKEGVQP